jgi:hypothetical protein
MQRHYGIDIKPEPNIMYAREIHKGNDDAMNQQHCDAKTRSETTVGRLVAR